MYIVRLPISWLSTDAPRLERAAKMNGRPVKAAAAIYEQLYSVAMTLFVET